MERRSCYVTLSWWHHFWMTTNQKFFLKVNSRCFKFIELIQFHLICQMLVKFSGFNLKGPYLSLEKEKETFCAVFTHSVKWAR